MTHHVPKEQQCFFRTCTYQASKYIHFKGQIIHVCKTHAKTWGSSYEGEQTKG